MVALEHHGLLVELHAPLAVISRIVIVSTKTAKMHLKYVLTLLHQERIVKIIPLIFCQYFPEYMRVSCIQRTLSKISLEEERFQVFMILIHQILRSRDKDFEIVRSATNVC